MPDVLKLRGGHPLLNFERAPIRMPHPYGQHEYGTFVYDTVEHYFQICKLFCLKPNANLDFEEMHDRMANERLPGAVKKMGRRLPIDVDLWDRSSFGYMFMAHVAKFTQHQRLQKMLIGTESSIIIEERPDPIWGSNMDGTGLNLCGKSLMLVRDRIL